MTTDNRNSSKQPNGSRLQKWWTDLLQILHTPVADLGKVDASAKDDAKNRLKLVLMHDRTNLSPNLLESMRDELMQVIAKYVEIDEKALELFLEQESNTIALVANISVVRRATGTEGKLETEAAAAKPDISPSSTS